MKTDPRSSISLWVVGPRHVNRLAGRLSGESMEWCYFGTDTSQRGEVAATFAPAKFVSVTEELNRVAYDTKHPFLDWIAEIGSRQTNELNWWASKIASKSPLQTDFFLLVCYHKLFGSWVAGKRQFGIRIVVAEDPWLRSLLQQDFAAIPGVTFLDSKLGVVSDAAYWLARVPLSMGYVILLSAWRKLIADLVLPRDRQVAGQVNPTAREILLYTWIEKSCFTSPDKLNDSYTGRLQEILTKNGERVKRLTSFSIQTKFLWRLRPFVHNLLVAPQYTTLGDILRSATSLFHINGLRKLPTLEGGDYTLLFYRELLHEWGAPGFATCQLSYRAMRRMVKNYGYNPKCVIYPFENQPWEKMLCMAFRDEAPGVRVIGYQHASVPSLLLCYFLGKHELKVTPLPDIIVTNGKATLDQLKNGGFPEEKLIDGGTFRFEYLFDVKVQSRLRDRACRGAYRILVAFPTFRPHAVCLLKDLLELFPTPFLDSYGEHSLAFILKCHPDLPWEMVGGQEGKLPEWFTLSTQPLSDLMEAVDLFLYSPPTGTWREAYWAGLPVLKYCGEFLDLDSTDILSTEELPVCSRETLRERIRTLLTEAAVSTRKARRGVLDEIFSPVNEKVWMQLVS